MATVAAMRIRAMSGDELDATVEVWYAARRATGTVPDDARVARVRQKLTSPQALTRVALRDGVVGMLLAEPGRADDGAGPPVPGLLHVSMVFVAPAAQRGGVGRALLRQLLDESRATGITTVALWTGVENAPARGLYESVGMTATRRRELSATRTWVRYEWELSPLWT